jgi:hypothetical protein
MPYLTADTKRREIGAKGLLVLSIVGGWLPRNRNTYERMRFGRNDFVM